MSHTAPRMKSSRIAAALMALCVGLGGMAYAVAEQDSGQLWHEGALVKEKVTSPFANLVKQLKPAVVNIRVTKAVQNAIDMREFFGFGGPRGFRQPPTQEGAGSGFIIHKDGYIVTNNHVVDGAEEIEVKLDNGSLYAAEVVGADPKTDITLLKLKDGPSDLPYAPLGDSSSLEIGEWVMAIGNPYGLEHTVTVGIVSAKGRAIGAGAYEDFIQTDASINPGNSGGPLFNTAGQVVGMNTAIIPGGQGLGFAVPVDMIKDILPQLRKDGKVTRALLGVQVQEMDLELAKQFGLDKPRGALVSQVVDDSAADKAKVRPGDLILEFDGKEVTRMRDLPLLVSRSPIGKDLQLVVLRAGKEVVLKVKLDEMPDQEGQTAQTRSNPSSAAGQLGIQFQPVDDEDGGLQITNINPQSPAAEANLQPGDIIRTANQQRVRNAADLQKVLSRSTGSLLLLVERDGGAAFVVVNLAK